LAHKFLELCVSGIKSQETGSSKDKDHTMSMISRFEDIQAWQEARQLVKMV
jgi:hypothetical protein